MSDLLLRALRGEETPRRPLWMMRQAGRYLPEYRALRKDHGFLELARNPELACRVTMQPLERFPLDAAIIFADLMSPVSALGIDFRFDPGPVIEAPLRTRAAIEALRVPAPEEVAPEVPSTLRLVKQELAGKAALIGFAGTPWSIAAYLVEGKGGKGFPRLRALMAEDSDALDLLLGTLTDLVAGYMIEQHKAGADVLQIFDSWAGLLSRADYHAHVEPHHRRLAERLGEAGVPTIYFAQGAPHLARAYADLPTDGLSLCWRTPLGELRAELDESGVKKALQGNLDPAVLLAGPDTTRAAAQALLASVPARGHIVNLGHGLTPDTPLESVEALIEVVHAAGQTG
ncbi:MAG: uroporphyrinogen decarboxylase [Planctomycetota bacterium]